MKEIVWAGIAFVDNVIQRNYGVCIDGELIIQADTVKNLKKQFPDAKIVGARHWLLIPGLVNSHDHGRAVSSVGFQVPDTWLELWLLRLGILPEIDPYLAAQIEGFNLLKSGVTTVCHNHNPRNWDNLYQEAEQTIRGYQDVGIRVAFNLPIVDQNLLVYNDENKFINSLPHSIKDFAKSQSQPPLITTKTYFDICTALFQSYHDSSRHQVHIQVSPAGGQWCCDELILEAVEWAKKHRTKVQMHLLETVYQRHYAYQCWGKSFIQHLDELDILGDWLTLAHLVWYDPEDIPLLASNNVGIVHNPSSNLRLRSGISNIARLLADNIAVGIGLDGLGLDDDQDFLREMRLAWTLSNQPGMNSLTVKPEEIWAMGTQKGIDITFGHQVPLGNLAPGNLADLVLIDYQKLPIRQRGVCEDFNLLRSLSKQQVKSVMVGGKWVMIDGQSVQIKEDEIEQALIGVINEHEKSCPSDILKQLTSYIHEFYRQQLRL